MARRLLRTAVAHLANVSAAQELGVAENLSEIEDVLVKHSLQPQLESLASLVVQSAENEIEARYMDHLMLSHPRYPLPLVEEDTVAC